MAKITESEVIRGVQFVRFDAISDDRGEFRETFRAEWFPRVNWTRVQTNRSDSRPHVLRGLHFHRHQTDYWLVATGTIRVGLCDLRASSVTFMGVDVLEMGDDNQMGLLVPHGVAHGFVSMTEVTVNYMVNNYYDGSDEHGVAWNDPELAVHWGVNEPIISPRDLNNPLFCDLPQHVRPD